MAKPNYKFEKRQKDLARQKKQEEKLQRKALKAETEDKTGPDSDEGQEPAGSDTTDEAK